jgi:transposase
MTGRPKVDLDSFKDEIIAKYNGGQQCNDIAGEYGVSGRTLERRIQSWGIWKRAPKRKSKNDLLGNPDVRIIIGICWDRNLSDEEMQNALADSDWHLSTRTIARIRKDMGILRRTSVFQRQQGVSHLWEIIEKELKNGTVSRYGRRHLHVHFKKIFRKFGHQLSR